MKQALHQDLFKVGIFFLVSMLMGWAIDQWRPRPLPQVYHSPAHRLDRQVEKISPAAATEPAEPAHIDLEAFRRWVFEKRGVIVDARADLFYQMGHVPGSLSLPRETFDKDYERQRDRLEENKRQPFVVYCSDVSCEDSRLVAKALMRLGYVPVFVYPGGWNEWTGHSLPVERER